MDITEQEAKRIFKFIVKKLGFEDACIEHIEHPIHIVNDEMHLTGIKRNRTWQIWLINDIFIGIVKGYSWADMLKNVIQLSNEAKSYCYIYADSINNRFNMPRTLEELRIMVDLES